jgi:23S rRNA-/tRNA-specific pseudouridylate synthase
LLEVYSKEFKAFSRNYYENAIEFWKNNDTEGTTIKGKITVNGKNIQLDYNIKDGDKIVHSTVREETPIYDELPRVIISTDDFIVVDKPSSIPVHACGNFRFNTLQSILEKDLNYVEPTD